MPPWLVDKRGHGDVVRIGLGKGDVNLTRKMCTVKHRSPAL